LSRLVRSAARLESRSADVCLTAAKDVVFLTDESHLPYHISPDVEVSKKQVEESCLHLEEATRWIEGQDRFDNTLRISLPFSLREAVWQRGKTNTERTSSTIAPPISVSARRTRRDG